MTTPEGFLTEEHRQRWAQVTYAIRACDLALSAAVDPMPGSRPDFADKLYKWEKVSAWLRSYLTAGIEHMMLWSDFVAPYEFDGSHVTESVSGPTF
ncbi:hypothetical protein IA539_01885 [Gordonia sp. zg691]|uniref:hypothetical protein n=1 Tax=Gordonia jinghuaiqii TaxID=2758710 RepID=UPI0016628C21|nr:hypothetical protein [Gordonia jinghuaiqii]MBD0859963.1 hypothetical protein [Gordonia jinghuaiqii]